MILILAFAVLPAAVHPTAARADNPIVQHVYTADPAPLVHNGRVYLYTGHDEDGSTSSFVMNDWRAWSSADMVNWTDHGSPLSLNTFSWAGANAWAGQAVERDGKFYWYVPVSVRATGRFAIGVAVSDSPTGPFRDALGHPLVENSEIDPTVFIDDDGQAYLYWGNPNLWYVKLNADMTSYAGSPVRIPLTTEGFGSRTDNPDRPTLYEEAPWVYKRNGMYFMVYAAKCCSEFIAYSTAPSPTGPWTYRGTVMPAQGNSFTNHAGIVDFQGNSYFFYHNGALPGGGGFTRSVAVEKFSYNADGTIPTINMTTAGAPQAGTLDPYVRQEAESIAWGSGIETEPSSEGGMNISWIENGDYIKVKGVAFGTGAGSFTARMASNTSGGRVELHLDSATGPTVGTCMVSGTGGWQTWSTVSCPVTGATGTHDLYLRFAGGSGYLFNMNWWQFTTGQSTFSSTAVVQHSGHCLDDPNQSTTDGTQYRQYTCGAGEEQRFDFRPVQGVADTYSLVNRHSGKCLDIRGVSTADGEAVHQWTCHGGTNQQFTLRHVAANDYQLVAVHSGKCVDVSGISTAVGALVHQWTCDSASALAAKKNQVWRLTGKS
ncbi:family 43 glycosylhydrolase [Streptomyces sp. NBC_00091]|uniref:family 43 glycosylhydrolase n=1 Tax=Streptomyces sp. NBC_00091 TaxID=2975648 RepID=UPI0022573545|nr:family 43 glycosylhydrolase [Streptomyces sp. NBC_00091]MCX5380193.1 family 43 glycosylhydrolase [Streptomyces sp. NBC_00091]MCX5380940.1 family 43 glycosylhydrolase [Streptomyces sp. NBC_00091]MCX5381661.1 family 43 glycosylhydrolase [Streptomyces sp. NBC_00091]